MRRKITAILAADVARYSHLVAEDEEETLRRLAAYRCVFDDFVARYGGSIFNTAGDSVMCEFESAVEAVRAAIDIQESLRTRNLAYLPSRWLQFRIGVAVGDVVERNGDLLGEAVNIVARLEQLAEPGGICISRTVHEAVAGKLSMPFVDLGEKEVKNIPVPVHAYAIAWPGSGPAAGARRSKPPVAQRPVVSVVAACSAATLLAGAALVAGRHLSTSSVGTPFAVMSGDHQGASAPSPADHAIQAASLQADPAQTFERIHQKGGLIEDPKTAPGLYHTALLFEAKGEKLGAHRAYYTLARMGLDFIDPHLRYAALVRTHEGKSVAREVYAELNEDAPTRTTALVHALQFDASERQAKIKALIAQHPDFAPAYFFLAEEHSEDRIGRGQSLKDKQIELAALTAFLKADREGRLAPFFLNQSILAEWREKARQRQSALEGSL